MSDDDQTLEEQLAQVTRAYAGQREQLSALREYVDALSELMRAAAAPADLAGDLERLDRALRVTCRAVEAEAGSLLILDEDTGELVFATVHGKHADRLLWQRMEPGTGIAGWVMRHGRSVVVNNAYSDDRFATEIEASFGEKTHDLVAAPLPGPDRLLGVVELLNKRDEQLFNRLDEEIATLAGHHVGRLLDGMSRTGNLADTFTVATRTLRLAEAEKVTSRR